MSIDVSSINSSIYALINRGGNSTIAGNKEEEATDINTVARNIASNMMATRKGLVDYVKKDTFTFSSDQNTSKTNKSLMDAVATMKPMTGMSSIEKYKYMMEQAQNMAKVDTTEPDAEKLLSQSEKIIQQALSQGISASDTINLTKALNAKQIALSRLDMIG